MGISYQQYQKYEIGANRMSATRLYQASTLFKESMNFFFEGYDESTTGEKIDLTNEQSVVDPEDRGLLKIIATYPKIKDPKFKRLALELICAAANESINLDE